jgi:hypothetical protein
MAVVTGRLLDSDLVLRAIGVTTAVSGLSLIAAPRTALLAMGARTNDPAPLLFRVVGMFMTVSGGLLIEDVGNRRVLRWSLVQKAGAVTGVTLGVVGGQYRPPALLVACFDGLCAALIARRFIRR